MRTYLPPTRGTETVRCSALMIAWNTALAVRQSNEHCWMMSATWNLDLPLGNMCMMQRSYMCMQAPTQIAHRCWATLRGQHKAALHVPPTPAACARSDFL